MATATATVAAKATVMATVTAGGGSGGGGGEDDTMLSFESNGIRWTGKVEMKGVPCCPACWAVD